MNNRLKENKNVVVENGVEYLYKEYAITVTPKFIEILKENKTIDVLRRENSLNGQLSKIQRRIDLCYYDLFKETLQASLSEKTKLIKTWKAIIDNRTCEHCKKLNGQSKTEWALFWVPIKGKVYKLAGPPLHWYFDKQGKKIITCRCRLEFSKDKSKLYDNEKVDEDKKDEKKTDKEVSTQKQ